MIAPADYFHLLPHGEALRERLRSTNNLRLAAVYGDQSEVSKFLVAAQCCWPHLSIIGSDEFRSHTTPEIQDHYQSTILVANHADRARHVDSWELLKTPMTVKQLITQWGGSLHNINAVSALIDAQLSGSLTLEEQINLWQLRRPSPRAYSKIKFLRGLLRDRNHQQKEETNMFTPAQLAAMSPQDYKQHRAQIMSGQYQAEVQMNIDRAKREASEAAHAANPRAREIKAMQQSRDEAAKKGKSTEIWDQSIARLEQEQEQDQKRKAFESSTEYESVVEVSMKLRDVVAKYDPASLPAVDAELVMYREHQNTDRLNTNLVKVSRDAWLKELAATREARHASLKAEHEAAQADLQREQERASNNELRAQFTEGDNQ